MKNFISLLVVVAVAACGGNSSSPDGKPADSNAGQTVVMGNLGGAPFTALDAVWNDDTATGFDFNGMSTSIEITSFAGDCGHQMARTGVPNGRLLFVQLGTTTGGNSAPATTNGAYPVFKGQPPQGNGAEVIFEIDGPNCLKSTSVGATSGTVTVTSATDPKTATFDVTFENGDHITGMVHATHCTALDPNSTPTGGC